MQEKRTTAAYKVVADSGGNRYKFYCDLSGALLCTTRVYNEKTPEQELLAAWEIEGKQHFNTCQKCGRLVSDAMFNPEVFECVDCAPYEAESKFCKNCGAKIYDPNSNCLECGKPLMYLGKGLDA